jgi:hypothetical protein
VHWLFLFDSFQTLNSADLVTMNETFVKARSIFDQMMEESLARHSQGSSCLPSHGIARRFWTNARSQRTIGLPTDTRVQLSVSLKRSVGTSRVTTNRVTTSLGTALIPSNNPDTRPNCIMDNRLTSTLSSNPLARTHNHPHHTVPRQHLDPTDPSHSHWALLLDLTRTACIISNLSSIRATEVRRCLALNYRRFSRWRSAARVGLRPPNQVSINPSRNRFRLSHNPRFNHSLHNRFNLNR